MASTWRRVRGSRRRVTPRSKQPALPGVALGSLRMPLWTPAAGVTAAAALGVALWFGAAGGHHAMMSADSQSNLEDLDIVASSDENSGDAMEMLQDDIEFYDWADKAAGTEPAA